MKLDLSKKYYSILILNIFLISLYILGFGFRYIEPFYVNDQSHLTWIITAFMVVNIGFSLIPNISDNEFARDNQYLRYMRYITGKFLYMGLIGTLIGMSALISNFHGATGDTVALLDTFKSNAATMFNPTLFGVVAYWWATANLFIIDGE